MKPHEVIEQASRGLTPLEQNVSSPGPGGESYDLAPTPSLRAAPEKTAELSDQLPLLGALAAFLAGAFVGSRLEIRWARSPL